MVFGLDRLTGQCIHHQPRRLQGRHAIAKTANILTQKAGAHFLLPISEVKMTPVTKRSVRSARIIKLF
jgi:hypothetical protein